MSRYHFLRIELGSEPEMDSKLNKLILSDEDVESITYMNNEVLVLLKVRERFQGSADNYDQAK